MAINEQTSPIGHNRGEDIEITYHDFLRTGPDTIGGRYLRSRRRSAPMSTRRNTA
jgi:hypothetical protein